MSKIEYLCQYPLSWPVGFSKTSGLRTRSAFKACSVSAAVGRVVAQLRSFTRVGKALRTDGIVITANVETLSPRNTTGAHTQRAGGRGGFRSTGPEPSDPGASLWFNLDGREVVLCCDKWTRVADNLTAIAKTLEAMRGLERWGVSETDRAFTGFTALPAPGQSKARTCWEILGLDPTQPHTVDSINAAYRARAKQCHPDAGGSAAAMSELTDAKNQALIHHE